MKFAAEMIALSDTAHDNNRKRDVYCRLSAPFNSSQKLHRVPALPPVHRAGQEALPAWAGGQPASEAAFVLVREVELEKLLKQTAHKIDCVFLSTGEYTKVTN